MFIICNATLDKSNYSTFNLASKTFEYSQKHKSFLRVKVTGKRISLSVFIRDCFLEKSVNFPPSIKLSLLPPRRCCNKTIKCRGSGPTTLFLEGITKPLFLKGKFCVSLKCVGDLTCFRRYSGAQRFVCVVVRLYIHMVIVVTCLPHLIGCCVFCHTFLGGFRFFNLRFVRQISVTLLIVKIHSWFIFSSVSQGLFVCSERCL